MGVVVVGWGVLVVVSKDWRVGEGVCYCFEYCVCIFRFVFVREKIDYGRGVGSGERVSRMIGCVHEA